METSRSTRSGFTLIELLLVIGIIAILAAIVIVAINPKKQLGDARDAQRRADVNTILNAVYQYSLDNQGNLPTGITTTVTGVCQTGASSCAGLVDLSVLTASGKYLVRIPTDPQVASGTGGTHYTIVKNSNGRITVAAPAAENTSSISVTR
jgi:type IV pilus assembly protein PilA